MPSVLSEFVEKSGASKGRCLLVVAAASEARAVLAGFGHDSDAPPDVWRPRGIHPAFDLLMSGVGKANAAGATAAALASNRFAAVINLGICGSLPHPDSVPVGACLLASASVLVDEGVEVPGGWKTMAESGFPTGIEGDSVLPDPALARVVAPLVVRSGRIATVSTCSGTQARAMETARRAGPDAIGEAMEGAAVGLAAHRFGVPFAEIRVVSNRTGDREAQGWNIPLALAEIRRIAMALGA